MTDAREVQVEIAADTKDLLGEGILWDPEEDSVWWVDVPMPSRLHRLEVRSGRVTSFPMPQMITAVRLTTDRNLLLVLCHSGVATFDIRQACFTHKLDPEPEFPFNRSNDAGVDSQGRLWFGTMQNNIAPDGSPIAIEGATGSLFSLGSDSALRRHRSSIGIANTVCWSPDHRTMYFSDTLSGIIDAYDYDPDRGTISNCRPFAAFHRGVPDGSCVDADGGVWNARWDGNCVVRFTPEGKPDTVIELPVAKPTSCAFGGPALDQLYITTAAYGMSDAERAERSSDGALLVCRPGVTGMPPHRFAGTLTS